MAAKYRTRYLDNLSKGVEGMWLKQRFTDVTIRVDDKAYACHKVLLGAVSGYFKELFMQEKGPTVDVANTNPLTFEAVLQYVYTGRTDLAQEKVQAVLKAAVDLQIPCLQGQCEDVLQSCLTPETCIAIWQLASGLKCSSLAAKGWSCILDLFPAVVKTEAFAGLDIETLIAIINDDDLNTPSEETVCTAVIRWVGTGPDGRGQYIERLLNYVRFPLMSVKYIESLKENPVIKNSKEAQEILKKVSAGTVNPRQIHHRTEEMICIVGTRNRQPKPECTELKCQSLKRDAEYNLASPPEEPGACSAVCAGENNLYLSGGYMGQSRLVKFVSSENRWNECTPLQEARWGHSMEFVDGAVYILGGSKKIPEIIASIEVHSPSTNSTSVIGSLAIPALFMATAVVGKKIYVFGGKLDHQILSEKIQCFDTETRRCSVVGTMPKVSPGTTRSVVLSNTVFVFYSTGEVLEYREGGEASVVANIPKFDHFGAVAHNGQIIIQGSYSNQPSTMVFDPSTREVTPYHRTLKSALCNFWCTTLVLSKQVLQ